MAQNTAQNDDQVVFALTEEEMEAWDERERRWPEETRLRREEQRTEAEERRQERGDGWNEWRAQQRAWEEENEEKEKNPQKWKMEQEKHIQKWAQKNTEIWKKSLDERSSSSNNNKQSDAAQYTWEWAKLENQEKTFLETGGLW
ncbi:hypothetical protein niasHT_018719 [Heterodera trifolii]|uniref:Uncharacterized protein n=1 Tax=Heterodera trifolii TaxID=157864 RepID=A0ABD2LBL0_9BILA